MTNSMSKIQAEFLRMMIRQLVHIPLRLTKTVCLLWQHMGKRIIFSIVNGSFWG
jgi:hypothetical protein